MFFDESRVIHRQSSADCYEAWRSHATLERQAGNRFESILASIRQILEAAGGGDITIPYDTRIWYAQLR